MLESILYFLLGFLAAGLLALMVSPVIWQRAVWLTKRSIERSIPLTLNEIQADKDQLRAEFAMSTRRLEISIDELRERAATQIIEINRKRDDLARLSQEQGDKTGALEELQTKSGEMRVQLGQREEQLEKSNTRLDKLTKSIDEKVLQFEDLQKRYENTQTESDGHKIELVAKQTELDNLSHKLEYMDQDAGDAGKTKKKLESVNQQLSQTGDRLERSERELARLRKFLEEDENTNSDIASRLVDQQSHNVELEAKLAKANLQMEALLHDASNDNVEKAMSSLEKEKSNLAGKLEKVSSERDDLVKELSKTNRKNGAEWESERRENSILRERINDLAAQVTAMTASLEGDASPINEILSRRDNTKAPSKKGKTKSKQPITLADRIRALQDASG